jgi:hypothetical protein
VSKRPLLAALTVAVVVAAPAGAARERPLRFETLWRSNGEGTGKRRTVSNHVVTIARRGFGYAVPAAAILRSPDGNLISKTTSFGPVRPVLCKA